MKIFKLIISFFILVTTISSCQTIQKKTNEIVEKENQKLEKYIGKSSKELKIKLGKPNEGYKNAKGNLELIYKTKKYGISCERKFEIDSNSIVIGFVSNGCF